METMTGRDRAMSMSTAVFISMSRPSCIIPILQAFAAANTATIDLAHDFESSPASRFDFDLTTASGTASG
jgi:hypothetical protein